MNTGFALVYLLGGLQTSYEGYEEITFKIIFCHYWTFCNGLCGFNYDNSLQ